MKKLSDLEKKDREDTKAKLEIFASLIDTDSWAAGTPKRSRTKDYGLCSDCIDFRFYKTEYGRGCGYCSLWRKYINKIDIIIECADYNKRGQMSLNDMKEIAVIIEIDDKKIGF